MGEDRPFSDREMLALAAIGKRCQSRDQRPAQADVIAEFVYWESQPSCALVKKRRFSRAENARHQGIARRRQRLGGNAA